MAIKYLKKAEKTAKSGEEKIQAIVNDLLSEIREKGEDKVKSLAKDFDKYEGNILITQEQIKAAHSKVSQKLKDDIQAAYENVRKFAQAQRDHLHDFEIELSKGLFAGQKQIPVNTAGCYIPGGRYAHIASAIMSITTAKVAGVPNIVACSPAKGDEGVHPAILYTMDLCGANHILALGGVQAIASMAFGLFTGHKADVLAGPGNAFVAESKRTLYGEVGIDMFAGPSEVAIIADKSADPHIIATDLVGQAEHGPTTPAWLFTNDETIAKESMKLVDEYIQTLPDIAKEAAFDAWRDYGEVILCDTKEELLEISDEYASEHLEIHTEDLDYYLDNLKNYGSLFVGEETTVAYGDKCSGTNHILPTKGAGKYTGGLFVGKFIKTVTFQRMSKEANKILAPVASRISRLEGMEAHARTADARLEKYFPKEYASGDFSLDLD